MVIGPIGVQFGLWTKSDDREAEVRFVNQEYDYWWNWTTRCPFTNWSKLWQNLRKKLDIGYASYKKNQQQQWTRRNAGQQRARMTRSVHSHRYDVLTVPLTVLFRSAIRRVPTVIRDLKQSGRKSQGRLRLKNKFLFSIRILKMAAFVYRLIRRHTSTSA